MLHSHIEYLSPDTLNRIHKSSLDLLEEVGVVFRLRNAREVLAEHGAKVEGDRVYLPAKMVTSLLEAAPREFRLRARNPQNDLEISPSSFVLAPGYGCPFVLDRSHARRRATLADYETFVKLVGSSPYIDVNGGIIVEPHDVHPVVRHIWMLYLTLSLSDKCVIGSSMGEAGAKDTIEMMSLIFGGPEEVQDRPSVISLINATAPLCYDERMLGALMVYASYGQPTVIASMVMAGATGPVTLAGTVTLQNAEVLAGIVLAQAIHPGTPVVYGAASAITDMRAGTPAIGAPEGAIISSIGAQMARYYGIPSRGGGCLTDSKVVDAQAGYESMMHLLAACVSGVNFVFHAVGVVDSYMTMSFEKFVVDEEICGMVKRFVGLKGAGEEDCFTADEVLATDVVRRVGPGGHFLLEDHTLKHHRGEFWLPAVSDRSLLEVWRNLGKTDAFERAEHIWRERVAGYRPPQLPRHVDDRLRNYVETRQQELGVKELLLSG